MVRDMPPTDGLRVDWLPEDHYDVRYRRYYLTYDVIICPWRICLLHLALGRETSPNKPFMILSSLNGNGHDGLATGNLCDAVLTQFEDMYLKFSFTSLKTSAVLSHLPSCVHEVFGGKKPVLEKESFHVSNKAIVNFMDYIAAEIHGSAGEWDVEFSQRTVDKALHEFETRMCERMKSQNQVTVKPIYPVADYAPTSELKTCFVIMPFDAEMTKFYEDVVKPVVISEGISIGRADDFFTVGRVVEDIWKRINEADFLLADLTGRNANVYYELGIAHTIGKPVILLAQSTDDAPFDIRDQRILKYGTRYDDIPAFKERLKASIAEVRREHASRSGIESFT